MRTDYLICCPALIQLTFWVIATANSTRLAASSQRSSGSSRIPAPTSAIGQSLFFLFFQGHHFPSWSSLGSLHCSPSTRRRHGGSVESSKGFLVTMPFFKDLRRRSRASFRTSHSTESQSNGDMTSGKSSSTLDTSYSGTTPPSSIKPTLSSPHLTALHKLNGHSNGSVPPVPSPPQRPVPIGSQSNRNSFVVGVLPLPNGVTQLSNAWY